MIIDQIATASNDEEMYIAKSSLKFEFNHNRGTFDETAAKWTEKYAED